MVASTKLSPQDNLSTQQVIRQNWLSGQNERIVSGRTDWVLEVSSEEGFTDLSPDLSTSRRCHGSLRTVRLSSVTSLTFQLLGRNGVLLCALLSSEDWNFYLLFVNRFCLFTTLI